MRFSATLAALAVLMTAGCTTPAAHHSTPHIDPNLRVAPNPTRAPEVSSVSVDFQLPLDEAGYFMVDPARLSGFAKQYNSVGEGQLTLHIPEWAVYAPGVLDVQNMLADAGVPPARVHIKPYSAWGNPLARSFLTFQSYQVAAEYCSADIDNLAESRIDFKPMNFGCSVRSNIAAMVDNPSDFVRHAPLKDATGSRGQVLTEQYYEGSLPEAPTTEVN